MIIPRKRLLVAPVLALALLTACNELRNFKAGFNATKPVVQSLVPAVITQKVADVVIKDVGDGVDAADRGEKCIAAIKAEGAPRKVAKGKCYLQVAVELRAILARHNIGGAKVLDTIKMIAEAAIAAFEGYYNDVAGAIAAKTMTSTAGAERTAKAADADKVLEATLKDLEKQLKALQP